MSYKNLIVVGNLIGKYLKPGGENIKWLFSWKKVRYVNLNEILDKNNKYNDLIIMKLKWGEIVSKTKTKTKLKLKPPHDWTFTMAEVDNKILEEVDNKKFVEVDNEKFVEVDNKILVELFKLQEEEHTAKFIMPYYQKDNIYVFDEYLLKKLGLGDFILDDIIIKNNLICHHQYRNSNKPQGYVFQYKDIEQRPSVIEDFKKSEFVFFHHEETDLVYYEIKKYLEGEENAEISLLNQIVNLLKIPKEFDDIDMKFLNSFTGEKVGNKLSESDYVNSLKEFIK